MTQKILKNIPFFTLLLSLLTLQGYAQQASKVGVINSQKVFQTSEEGKKAVSQLKQKEESIKQELGKIDERIQNLQTKLNTQRLTLTDEAVMQITSDLERASTERKRNEEDSAKEYQMLVQRLWQKVRIEVVPIIEQYAKEKGFDIVLDLSAGGITYFNQTIDVTDAVIQRYNESKSKK